MSEVLKKQDADTRKRLETEGFSGNFLVSAGAGAGKTYTTVERVYNMLLDPRAEVQPQDIVMITMTIRAATEMKTRLSDKIRAESEKADPAKKKRLDFMMEKLPEMQISTIHSFCRRILNDYPLESGVGFAPKFESEEGALKNSAEIWFKDAWKEDRCPECKRLGIKQKTALNLLKALNQFPTTLPQYLNPEDEEYRAEFEETMKECRRKVDEFGSSMGNLDPDLLHYKLRNAVLAGDEATEAQILAAALLIAKKGPELIWWMGKDSRLKKGGLCRRLLAFMDQKEPTDEDLDKADAILEKGKELKGADRQAEFLDWAGELPEGYRDLARLSGDLPDEEELKELDARIDRMVHAIVTKEIFGLKQEYAEERRRDHAVTLTDMLVRTAELVRDHPEVRRKLHERYKVFFVDEYQDTNPIQTDIIFAIAADEYDPDWRKSIPGAGRLFFVGDAKQGIYRFTGADIALWREAKEVIEKTGGEVAVLSKNFRSTPEICDSVSEVFCKGKTLKMTDDEYQIGFQEMVADRDHGTSSAAVYHHVIPCYERNNPEPFIEPYTMAAEQVARYIRWRHDTEGNEYGDFLVLSFNREKHDEYPIAFRKYGIPVKYDGMLKISGYHPIELMNLRVQAVSHPFDERLSFRVLCECGNVLPQEWDLFRMTVEGLPEETKLTKYRTTRGLMNHVDELGNLLPLTEMNQKILNALRMLDDDRVKSQHMEPCAFLSDMAEKSIGLFRDPYDAEAYRNQYAALRHVIDSIRDKNPQHFDEMADMLQAVVESELDRMPTVRADDNYVRLMNLHKVKGLQGKILIFLPSMISYVKADHHVRRDGTKSEGWFVIKGDKESHYHPPEWDKRKEEEKAFLKAERVRLKYVALTRAEDEAHFFDFLRPDKKPGGSTEEAWKGFEDVGVKGEDDIPETFGEEEEEDIDGFVETALAEWNGLQAGLQDVNRTHAARKTPSAIDKETEDAELLRIQNASDEDEDEENEVIYTVAEPGGKDWGSAVHKAAEIVVQEGKFTADALRAAAMQGVTEQFDSELLSAQERENLQLPDDKIELEDIRNWLADRIVERLSFMLDENSSFRKKLQGAAINTEMPFVISVGPLDGRVYDDLASLMNVRGGKRLEMNGKIDLALRYPDGIWFIADYKTDRMLPVDLGSVENYKARLNRLYKNQLAIYKIVLEYLTGETVSETKLLTM